MQHERTIISIEHSGVKCVIEQNDIYSLPEILNLIQQALLGVGLSFKGELYISEDSEEDDISLD